MTYLIVGLDRSTLAPWQRHVRERDAASATRTAVARAGADGVDLVVAAGIGPHKRGATNAACTHEAPRHPAAHAAPNAVTDRLSATPARAGRSSAAP